MRCFCAVRLCDDDKVAAVGDGNFTWIRGDAFDSWDKAPEHVSKCMYSKMQSLSLKESGGRGGERLGGSALNIEGWQSRCIQTILPTQTSTTTISWNRMNHANVFLLETREPLSSNSGTLYSFSEKGIETSEFILCGLCFILKPTFSQHRQIIVYPVLRSGDTCTPRYENTR